MDISSDLRDFVASRAGFRCEYCLLHRDDSWSPHHIDHIIGRKHGGRSTADNLAYCCFRCNLWKGTDLGSLLGPTFVRFYNPRTDRWNHHFKLIGVIIEPLTAEAEVTVRILRINLDKRLAERRLLLAARRYPPPQ